jgi:hypothetical protein
MVQDISRAQGMRCLLLGQRERVMAPLQSLVWVAKTPQDQSRTKEAGHARIIPVEDGQSMVLRWIVQGKALLKVLLGRGKLSKPEQERPQRMVGF